MKPMVTSEIQIRFLFKTTDTTTNENANPDDGFCSEYFVCEGKSNNFLGLETELQVCKWGISTALQCIRSRLFSRTVLRYMRTVTENLN